MEIQVVHDAPEVELTVEGLKAIVNRRVPGISPPSWDFEAEGDPEGWAPRHDLEPFEVKGGILRTKSTGPDPYMVGPPIRADARRYKRFCLKMRLVMPKGTSPVGQLFWARMDERYFTEPKSVKFPLKPDGQFYVYCLDLEGHPEWRGTITRLRLDPGSGSGIEVEIDWMRLE